MPGTVTDDLFHKVADVHERPHGKVTVVGVGQVGMACAFSVLVQVCSSTLIKSLKPDTLAWISAKCLGGGQFY